MRILFIVLILTACASKPQPRPYITLAQLQSMQLTQEDCTNKDLLIEKLEQQQINAGIPRTDPRLLPPLAREYQSRIRSAVWALRIGCENPARYN